MYSSSRLYTELCMTVPAEKSRKSGKWNEFVAIMTQYYKPTVEFLTDHKPLSSICNKHRQGSIRTDRTKLRDKCVIYQVIYQKGKLNQSEYQLISTQKTF